MGISYRSIGTFGPGTIRRFSNNVSDLKRPAARDYEDLLQVNIAWYVLQIPISFTVFATLL
jgi:hypothetical protein